MPASCASLSLSALTRKLVAAGELMDVQVLDRVVVVATRYRRMREAGLGW